MRCNLLLLLSLVTSLALSAKELTGRVVRIADGDTLTILDETKTQHKIRLDKIDAPEKGQAFGRVSRNQLSSIVFGKDVRVTYEKTDRYGRILGTVWFGETDVNLAMVKAGLAWHYKHFDNTQVYADAEKSARANRFGLWKDKAQTSPWEFRKTSRR